MSRRFTTALALSLAASLSLTATASIGAQRASAFHAGIAPLPLPQDTTPPERNPLLPPPADRFKVAATYIWLSAAFGAGAGAVSSQSRDCSDCTYAGAILGSFIGTGVGEKLARSALRCEQTGFLGRTALASLLVGGTALMIAKSNPRVGDWTAIIGMPVASSYLVGGCPSK